MVDFFFAPLFIFSRSEKKTQPKSSDVYPVTIYYCLFGGIEKRYRDVELVREFEVDKLIGFDESRTATTASLSTIALE